ncbi:MAG: hypothetical protein F6K55_35100 [Moorea sp. SIO4A3]|nr:hypothetical protein [Moorena sp. SIO4A3]
MGETTAVAHGGDPQDRAASLFAHPTSCTDTNSCILLSICATRTLR